MMKGRGKYIVVLVLCFIALVAIHVLTPKPVDWTPSYSSKDKVPYGTSALRSALPDLFPGQRVQDVSMPVYNTLESPDAPKSNYIVINELFSTDSLDLRRLLGYIKKGSSAFIAANEFEGAFADSLKLETALFYDAQNRQRIDSAALTTIYGRKGDRTINFTNPQLRSDSGYTYTNCFNSVCFSSFDTLKAKVLGCNNAGQVNFISMKIGSGMLYVSTVPEAFCNYHFVNERNDAYVVKALSYLPDAPLLWDEFYKVRNKQDDSSLRVIFRHPALSMAYYVLIVSLLLFVIIGVKRRQRIIPVIEPLRNTTLQFVDVVGALYYQTGNHKNIAEKKITYFLEYIRHAFQVQTSLFDDAFYNRVISLSGIDREKVHTLFRFFTEIRSREAVTQEDLVRLNTLIEEFYTLNKR